LNALVKLGATSRRLVDLLYTDKCRQNQGVYKYTRYNRTHILKPPPPLPPGQNRFDRFISARIFFAVTNQSLPRSLIQYCNKTILENSDACSYHNGYIPSTRRQLLGNLRRIFDFHHSLRKLLLAAALQLQYISYQPITLFWLCFSLYENF
jgi:hypothetical protein